jgi:hypothetical protein
LAGTMRVRVCVSARTHARARVHAHTLHTTHHMPTCWTDVLTHGAVAQRGLARVGSGTLGRRNLRSGESGRESDGVITPQ